MHRCIELPGMQLCMYMESGFIDPHTVHLLQWHHCNVKALDDVSHIIFLIAFFPALQL